MNKVLIKKIFAAMTAAAVMASFTAVSVYAEPDMVIGDEEPEEDVEYSDEDIVVEDEGEDAEEEDPEELPEEDTEETPEEDTEGDVPTDDDLLNSLPEPTYTPTGDLTMYASTTINVRQGPSTDYDKLGVLYAGDKVTVVGYNGEWMAFTYSGTTGYVLGSLLAETPPAPETTTTTQAPQTAPPETEPPVEQETEAPVETDLVIEDDEPEVTEPEEEAPTTKPVEDEPEEDKEDEDDEETGAAPVEDDKNGSGLQGILIAALCALGTFILVGVLPVVIHRIHHKKLYQY